ncbi:MAG TPA: FtsX-like permease family protein [Burkholderiales bacterium]|nr:FtsX-like permease family protein [Burkholderiales bacterium]
MSAARAGAGALAMIALAMRLLARDWRAGEQRLLALSIAVAVAGVTTVAFFADRVGRSLTSEAGQLLGADLVVVSDQPLDAKFEATARGLGLAVTAAVRFPSMAQFGDGAVLAEVKAVQAGYPLRGKLRIRTTGSGRDFEPHAVPEPGEAWIDERLLRRLGMRVGERIGLGDREFTVAAIVSEEPESSAGFFNLGPRLMMNAADLPSTGLIQTGSRVSYRLFVAGAAPAVASFRNFAGKAVGAGQRVEDIRDARPEIRSALERAERFLGLAALMTVILAGVAVALGARRYLQRHLDACAIMRCLGAGQRTILALHALQFAAIGLAASAAGCVAGFACQFALAAVLAPIVAVSLPAPGWGPPAYGMATGFVMLLGFALPPVIALRKVPALRVLRRDLGAPDSAGLSAYALGTAAVAGLVLWQARDMKLGLYVLGGIAGTAALCTALTLLLLKMLAGTGRGAGFNWRFGVANLRRHRAGSILQVLALALGLMALILLTLVRGELLENWRRSLPPDAPNRFLVAIQPDQREAIARFFESEGVAAPAMFPMVRGRLVSINGRPVSPRDYADDRARRLVSREFNLSWARTMQPDNVVVAGRWFGDADAGKPVLSMEEGIAATLGVKLGDELGYDIAGSRVAATVTSLRKVEWDTFRVNFFVVAPPGVLEKFPASYVTSLHLPAARSALLDRLVLRFPNLVVIDVAAILGQIQRMMDQVVRAIEFVFLFSVAAGVLVLYAAIAGTQDERRFDAAVMRSLGASARQLRAVQAVEFALIGALAGLFAALGATAVGYFLASRVLNLPYSLDPRVWLAGLVVGCAGVTAAGMLGAGKALRTPPAEVFRATS